MPINKLFSNGISIPTCQPNQIIDVIVMVKNQIIDVGGISVSKILFVYQLSNWAILNNSM